MIMCEKCRTKYATCLLGSLASLTGSKPVAIRRWTDSCTVPRLLHAVLCLHHNAHTLRVLVGKRTRLEYNPLQLDTRRTQLQLTVQPLQHMDDITTESNEGKPGSQQTAMHTQVHKNQRSQYANRK